MYAIDTGSSEAENRDLRRLIAEEKRRRCEAEELLAAIRQQEVDALVLGPQGHEQVYVLESAERPYRLMVESMAEGAVTLSSDGTILYCNGRFAELCGVRREEALGRDVSAFLFEMDEERVQELLRAGRASSSRGEAQLRAPDGKFIPVQFTVKALPSPSDGQVIVVVTDLTQTKQYEAMTAAQAALCERQAEVERLNQRLERAMRETHHRVKNNLQVVAALVDWQLMKGEPSVSLEELERLARYLRSLAAVHDLLTQEVHAGGETDQVSIEQVLAKLRPLLDGMTHGRALHFEVQDAQLPVRQGISIAVLMHELLSNAVKHGRGEIDLSFAVCKDRARLEVCDQGPGFPDGFDPKKSANTGIDLILSTGQWDLQGTVTFENRDQGGACVAVSFPVPQS